jgi:4'-phosphopantetheinyl transferase
MTLRKNFYQVFRFESAGIWQDPPLTPSGIFPVLENDQFHIWSVRYSDLSADCSCVSDFLSKTEHEVSSRFLNPDDTRKYILRHGMVRYILGSYTGIEPELLPLVTGMNGKPGLDPKSDFHQLSFSLSHTDQAVSMVVIKKYRIGIDITKPDPLYPYDEISGYLFTSLEKKVLRETEPVQRCQIFFQIWALKEAIVKATGDGIRLMNTTDVTPVIAVSSNASLHRLTISEKPMNFFMYRFRPDAEHIGAVAVCLEREK